MEIQIENKLLEGTKEALELYGEIEEKYKLTGGYEIETQIEKEFLSIGLPLLTLNKKFSILSGGEKTKVKLVALFLKDGIFPLLDEPTNHLDMHSREFVADYLKNKHIGFICVSHDEYFLDKVGTHIINIHSKKGLELKKSKFSDFHNEMKLINEKSQEKNESLKREISKKIDSFREKCDWSFAAEDKKEGASDKGFMGAKAARLMKRAKNLEKRLLKDIDDKKSLVENFEKEYLLKFPKNDNRTKELIRVNNIGVSFDDKILIENFSLTIEKGERIAIIGPNGCGKSSILKKIISDFSSKQIKISYIAQEFSYKNELLKDYLLRENIDISEFGRFLASFDMRGEILEKNLKAFSQGEKRKIALALSIYAKADLYIWDEPLNFLDIGLMEKITNAILIDKPTMLFVEHNKSFVDNIATRIIEMR